MKCLDFIQPGGKSGEKIVNESFSIFEKQKKNIFSDYLNFNHVFIGKNVSEIK